MLIPVKEIPVLAKVMNDWHWQDKNLIFSLEMPKWKVLQSQLCDYYQGNQSWVIRLHIFRNARTRYLCHRAKIY